MKRARRMRRTSRLAATGLVLAALAGAGRAQTVEPFVPVFDGQGFLRATPGRPLVLPRDHGSHPATRTEWWYLTGALTAEDGEPLAFQATWFRRALVPAVPAGRSPLAARDLMLFHGVISELDSGQVRFSEQACRAYAPWAHAAEGALEVALLAHSLRAVDDDARAARLEFGAGDARLELDLGLSTGPPLLHGREPGLSIKGAEAGEASWYYSLPRVPVRGTLRRPGRADVAVSGQAWFDHEFGSSQLSGGQVGWDWFSVALDDGSDLMIYRLRRGDDSTDASSAGTFRDAAGRRRTVDAAGFAIAPDGEWTSPRAGVRYPSGWTLRVPDEDLVLTVRPLLPDQELLTPASTGVTYWEGLCTFTGTRAGRRVSGRGFVELVGYDRRFTERL